MENEPTEEEVETETDGLEIEEDETLELETDSEDEVIEEDSTEDSVEIEEESTEKPKKVHRSFKRITKLIENNKELKSKLEELESKFSFLSEAEKSRSTKETSSLNEMRLQDITQKQKEAFESGDFDSVTKLNLELMKLNNSVPDKQTIYFKGKNPWYNNSSLDPGRKKTLYAKALSTELMNDPQYQSWSKHK